MHLTCLIFCYILKEAREGMELFYIKYVSEFTRILGFVILRVFS